MFIDRVCRIFCFDLSGLKKKLLLHISILSLYKKISVACKIQVCYLFFSIFLFQDELYEVDVTEDTTNEVISAKFLSGNIVIKPVLIIEGHIIFLS